MCVVVIVHIHASVTQIGAVLKGHSQVQVQEVHDDEQHANEGVLVGEHALPGLDAVVRPLHQGVQEEDEEEQGRSTDGQLEKNNTHSSRG